MKKILYLVAAGFSFSGILNLDAMLRRIPCSRMLHQPITTQNSVGFKMLAPYYAYLVDQLSQSTFYHSSGVKVYPVPFPVDGMISHIVSSMFYEDEDSVQFFNYPENVQDSLASKALLQNNEGNVCFTSSGIYFVDDKQVTTFQEFVTDFENLVTRIRHGWHFSNHHGSEIFKGMSRSPEEWLLFTKVDHFDVREIWLTNVFIKKCGLEKDINVWYSNALRGRKILCLWVKKDALEKAIEYFDIAVDE